MDVRVRLGCLERVLAITSSFSVGFKAQVE